MRPVENEKGVQAWQDDSGVVHLVGFTQEPNRLGCKNTPMWNYVPRFYPRSDISCQRCLVVLTNAQLVQWVGLPRKSKG